MLNRLLGTIYILMNRGSVTAAELAEHYEVSVRTIYRDVEALSMAGIPVYTRKGKNGGISLTEQFVLNKMLVTKEEQQQILAALCSMEETGNHSEKKILEKLGVFFQVEPSNWISIDFSDWSNSRQEVFEQIKTAILNHKKLTFDYYGQYGDMSTRTVEPVQLPFKEYTWYVKAYCLEKQAMRLFKVPRMKRIEMLEESFAPDRSRHQEKAEVGNKEYDDRRTEITLLINKTEAYRVYDRFDEGEISVQDNGDFLIRVHYLLDEWVYGFILSFGAAATVLEPAEVRCGVRKRLINMLEEYKE